MTKHPSNPDAPCTSSRIARDLTGDLYCLKCRYNLRGLSILQLCPECGLPVKATLLAVVDPLADELAPLFTPRFTALGLVLWPLGALLTAVVVWGLRLYELAPIRGWPQPERWWIKIGIVGILLSAIGALSLVRPLVTISKKTSLRNLIGIMAYFPVAWGFWLLHANLDVQSPMPYATLNAAHELRSPTRIGILLSAAFCIAALRPTVLTLAARSMVVREGRVDRQPMLALIGAFFLSAVGDMIHIAGEHYPFLANDFTRTLEMLLVALGSVLITLGLFGLVRDGIRVFSVISSNPLGLADILERRREKNE